MKKSLRQLILQSLVVPCGYFTRVNDSATTSVMYSLIGGATMLRVFEEEDYILVGNIISQDLKGFLASFEASAKYVTRQNDGRIRKKENLRLWMKIKRHKRMQRHPKRPRLLMHWVVFIQLILVLPLLREHLPNVFFAKLCSSIIESLLSLSLCNSEISLQFGKSVWIMLLKALSHLIFEIASSQRSQLVMANKIFAKCLTHSDYEVF